MWYDSTTNVVIADNIKSRRRERHANRGSTSWVQEQVEKDPNLGRIWPGGVSVRVAVDGADGGVGCGVLKEESAMEPVTSLIAHHPEQMRQGIPDIQQIHWDAYKSLLDQGQLKEHICVLWHAGSMESARKALSEINSVPRLPASLGDDRVLSCGVKIFMDGSGGARTGWVYDDWLRNATTPDVTSSGVGNRGYPQVDPAVYQEMVRLFHQNGVPVGTHAAVDRAMDWVVAPYPLVEQEQPHPGLRHSIIHANLPTARTPST